MMHEGDVRLFYSMLSRIGKLNRRLGANEKNCEMVSFGLLFAGEESRSCVRMTEVSQFLMISKPAATQLVNRLVEMGFVERVDDPNDRRVVYIQPTEAGKRCFEEELEKRLTIIRRAMQRIGEARSLKLMDAMTDLLDAMIAEAEESKC